MSYLSKMTVKDLRDIAARMDIYLQSRVKKDTIVFLIETRIENLHAEGLEMNAEPSYTVEGTDVTFTGDNARIMIEHEKRVKRYNPTFKRDKNGKVILTPKQMRRVQKKTRQTAKRLGVLV